MSNDKPYQKQFQFAGMFCLEQSFWLLSLLLLPTLQVLFLLLLLHPWLKLTLFNVLLWLLFNCKRTTIHNNLGTAGADKLTSTWQCRRRCTLVA